jgi:hypothetical protein
VKTSNLELLLVLTMTVACADAESSGSAKDGGAERGESSVDSAGDSEESAAGATDSTSESANTGSPTEDGDDDSSDESGGSASDTDGESGGEGESADESDGSDVGTETEPDASSSADPLSETGDDSSASTEPLELPDPLSLAALCELMRDAWLADCEATSAYDDCSAAAALTVGQRRCEEATLAVDAGRLTYDGVQAALCVEAGSVDWVEAWTWGRIAEAHCEGLMVSAASPPAACYSDETFQEPCAVGYCDRSEGCPGTCVDYLLPGDSCDGSVWCDPAAFCNQEGECQAYGLEGELCSAYECLFPLVCFNGSCRQSGEVGAECNDQDAPCADLLVCVDGVCDDSVPAGEVCTFSVQCPADHSCLYSPPGGSELRCEPTPHLGDACDVRDGNTCADPDSQCLADDGKLVGSCVSFYVGEGAACGDGVGDCADEFYCRQGTDPALGTCVPDAGEEENCGDAVFQGLFNNPCLDGLHCMVTSTNTCLPPSDLDGPCFYNNTESCVDGLFCDIATSSCLEPKALGERCSPSDPEGSCQTGRCELVPAEDCESAPFGDCEDAICNALRANGEACENDLQCSSGYCALGNDPELCEDQPTGTPWCVAGG